MSELWIRAMASVFFGGLMDGEENVPNPHMQRNRKTLVPPITSSGLELFELWMRTDHAHNAKVNLLAHGLK
jgi:hypothetical protein